MATIPNPDNSTASEEVKLSSQTALFRKINLNVDIATQAELISVYNDLTAKIGNASDAYKTADQNLSTDLKTWAKGSELSGALVSELSVAVEKQKTAETGYAATYVIKQGGTALTPKINIPKDFLVKSAELCVVTTANDPYTGAAVGDKYIDFVLNTADTEQGSETPKHVYLPINDLVDTYTGDQDSTEAKVNVGADNNVISVAIQETIARVGTSGDLSSANTIYGAKAYADAKVQAASHTHENKAVLDTISSDDLVSWDDAAAVAGVVKSTSATWDAAATALQSIGAGTAHDYVTVTIPAKAEGATTQTVEVAVTTADLTANTAGLAVNTDVKQYVDDAVSSKNVDAEGETGATALISASAANNKVTVGSTDKLTAAVAAAESALQKADITEGATNGTITVKGADVAVHGLGTAAYTLSSAYDKAGDAAALQTAVIAAVNDARFDSAATDDYADIDAIIADLVKVRKALGALKALSVTLTPAQA